MYMASLCPHDTLVIHKASPVHSHIVYIKAPIHKVMWVLQDYMQLCTCVTTLAIHVYITLFFFSDSEQFTQYSPYWQLLQWSGNPVHLVVFMNEFCWYLAASDLPENGVTSRRGMLRFVNFTRHTVTVIQLNLAAHRQSMRY